jgi:signal transduction histidine kinase
MLLEDAGPELSVGNRSLLENQIRSANKLGQIISDLLTLSRISRTEIAMRPLDLTELAKDVTGSVFEAEVDPHRVDIEEGLRAMGDATLVYVVLLNLFENARKFSPRGGTVSFGRAQGSDENTFVVRDEGVGFPMEYAGKVFQPFQRLVGEGEFEGTGIGLANVQRAIERHGGHVWVESQPGKGSCFYFTLPFVQEGQA